MRGRPMGRPAVRKPGGPMRGRDQFKDRRLSAENNHVKDFDRIKRRGGRPGPAATNPRGRLARRPHSFSPDDGFKRPANFIDRKDDRRGPGPGPPFEERRMRNDRRSPGRMSDAGPRRIEQEYRRPSPISWNFGSREDSRLIPPPDVREELILRGQAKAKRPLSSRSPPSGKGRREIDTKRSRDDYRRLSPTVRREPSPKRLPYRGAETSPKEKPSRSYNKREYENSRIDEEKRDFENSSRRGREPRREFHPEEEFKRMPAARYEHSRDERRGASPPGHSSRPEGSRRDNSRYPEREDVGRHSKSKLRKGDRPTYRGPEHEDEPSAADLKRIVVEVSRNSYRSPPREDKRHFEPPSLIEPKRSYHSPIRMPVTSRATFPERPPMRSSPPRDVFSSQRLGPPQRLREAVRPWDHSAAEIHRMRTETAWAEADLRKPIRGDLRHGLLSERGEDNLLRRERRDAFGASFDGRDARLMRVEDRMSPPHRPGQWIERERILREEPRFLGDHDLRRGRSAERIRTMVPYPTEHRQFAPHPLTRRPF